MFTDFDDVTSANVDNGTADTFGRFNDNVVILSHLEGIQFLGLSPSNVEDSLVNGVGDAVVDEFGQYQTVLALVKHFEGVGREWQAATNIDIAIQNGVDVTGKFGSFIFIDGVGDVCAGTLNLNFAAMTALGDVSASSLGCNTDNTAWAGWRWTCGDPLLSR